MDMIYQMKHAASASHRSLRIGGCLHHIRRRGDQEMNIWHIPGGCDSVS